MAGGRLGTVFVELQLDDKPYKQRLSETLTSTQATTKGLETSWRALGVKTNQYFDESRRSAENAYQLIQKSGKYAADEIVRAEQAKNEKIKRLNEQQFGHQNNLLEGMKKNWAAASVAIVAAIATVKEAIEYMDKGAKALQQESAFKIMADSAGVNSEKMIAAMKAATKETVDDSDMMQKAIKLLTLSYDPEQIVRFSNVVITASQIAGVTAAEAYDALADAIANRMPKALVKMGAVTKEQMEIVTKAIDAGASSTALFELAMANLELKQRMLQGTQDGATVALQKFHAEVSQLKEEIGKGLIVVTQKLLAEFQVLAAGVLGLSGNLGKLAEVYARYRALVYEAMGDEKKAAQNRQFADEALAFSNNAWGARNELMEKAAVNMYGVEAAGKKATAQEIAGSKAVVDSQIAKLKAIAGAKDAEKALDEKYKHEMEILLAVAKAEEDIRKEAEAGAKTSADTINRLLDEKYKHEMDILLAVAKAEDDMRKDIEAGVKTSTERIIKMEADANKKILDDAEAAMMSEIELGVELSKNTLDRIEKDSEVFKEAARGIHQSFVSMFEELFDGGLTSFKKFADSIFNVFKRMLAQMATLAIARPIIVPMVTALGGALGVPEATAGVLSSMGISGPAAGGLGGAASGTAAGAGFAFGLENMIGSLQSNAGLMAARGATYLFGVETGTVIGQTILDLSQEAFAGWTAGIGTFIVDLLSGKKLVDSLVHAAATGGGAWGGATIGTMILPGVGTFIGAAIGSLIGSFVGGLFGKDKENEFTLTELINATAFGAGGFQKVGSTLTGGGDTGAWYNPIANAYSAVIETIQQSFNTMVFDFASKLPQEMQTQILDELRATDFGALQSGVSGGRWKISEAEGAIGDIAKKYAAALATTLGNAYANALGDYISAKGAAGLIGDTSAWGMLTDKVQQNINDMFTGIAATIKGGDLEGGLKAVNEIVTVIGNIGRAMAPIAQIITTKGLDEYGLQLYEINSQFDAYAETLRQAGVDLEKYTALEEARQIMLQRVELARAEAALDTAKDNLRKAFDAEKKRMTEEYNAELAVMNKALDATKRVIADLKSNVDKLRAARERMKLVDVAADQASFIGAQREVARVLEQARKGDLKGLKDVQKSVDILADITPEMYANSTDYKRDFMYAYNAITELEGYANEQLTEAQEGQKLQESALETLAETYKEQIAWRDDQMDALLRIDNSILTIPEAIKALEEAFLAVIAAGGKVPARQTIPINPQINRDYQTLFGRQAEEEGAAYWQGTNLTGSALTESIKWGAQGSDLATMVSRGLGTPIQMAINEAYQGIMGRAADAEGLAFYQNQIASGQKTMDQIMADLEWAKGHGALASGLDYVPHDGPAYIHKGEAVLPVEDASLWRRGKVYGNKDQASNAELITAIGKLEQRLGRIERNTSKTSDTLTIVTRGGKAILTEAFT